MREIFDKVKGVADVFTQNIFDAETRKYLGLGIIANMVIPLHEIVYDFVSKVTTQAILPHVTKVEVEKDSSGNATSVTVKPFIRPSRLVAITSAVAGTAVAYGGLHLIDNSDDEVMKYLGGYIAAGGVLTVFAGIMNALMDDTKAAKEYADKVLQDIGSKKAQELGAGVQVSVEAPAHPFLG